MISCYKEVNEDWYPCFPPVANGDKPLVWVGVYDNRPIERNSIVCVWGNDDCGMELISDYDTCLSVYKEIASASEVTRLFLKELGLRAA